MFTVNACTKTREPVNETLISPDDGFYFSQASGNWLDKANRVCIFYKCQWSWSQSRLTNKPACPLTARGSRSTRRELTWILGEHANTACCEAALLPAAPPEPVVSCDLTSSTVLFPFLMKRSIKRPHDRPQDVAR